METVRIQKIMLRKGNIGVASVRNELGRMMEDSAGINRNEKKIREGLKTLEVIKSKSKKIVLTDHGTIFNGELTQLFELEGMIVTAQCILLSALERKESRGAHYREDYPERNDNDFLHHQTMSITDGHMKLAKKPVVITQWKAAERNY